MVFTEVPNKEAVGSCSNQRRIPLTRQDNTSDAPAYFRAPPRTSPTLYLTLISSMTAPAPGR